MNKVYDIVMNDRKELVDKLIEQMELGKIPTRAAWNNLFSGSPYNPVSKVSYRAGNRFRLMLSAAINGFSDPRWMTYKQAAENHYKILPGSKGVLLEKWIFYKEKPLLDENKNPVIDSNSGKPVIQRELLKTPYVNYFRVFNGEQISGLPELTRPQITKDNIYQMETQFVNSSKCPVYYESINSAYYSPSEDAIHLPSKEAFKSNEARLSVLLHEMAHSTGHENRLNRDMHNKFGSIDYAKEELNAEISSLFMESDLGIRLDVNTELMEDHADYIKNWISLLKNDPNELFRACATADKISEYLIKNYEEVLEMDKNLSLEKHLDDSCFLNVSECFDTLRESILNAPDQSIHSNMDDFPAGRIVNNSFPQDYIDIYVSNSDKATCHSSAIHSNEVIDIKSFDFNGDFSETLREQLSMLDTDYEAGFSLYSDISASAFSLNEHFELLKDAGYEEFPDTNAFLQKDSIPQQTVHATHPENIQDASYASSLKASFKKNHLKPTEKILDSIEKLNKLTNTQNSLKDICSMYKNPDSSHSAETRTLVNSIGDELKMQELHMQQVLQAGVEM